ncbi:MAG: ATP-binding cassette domain-containing protein [Desulfuromonadales bacterium]
MAQIGVRDLYKIFGSPDQIEKALEMAKQGKSRNEINEVTGCVLAVNNVGFSVEGEQIFVIMGLSGSGKSTLLRCINRLIEPTSGEVTIDGDDVLALKKDSLREWLKKNTAMVFQHFGLLDHRTVLGNAAFGLELQDVPLEERQDKARKTLKLVGLENEAESMIDQLSGGQQQRVGLARALATDADILLMDRALNALSMVVIAAMIGAGGLGQQVLKGIEQLKIGLGFESGLAVVILAMFLDRVTQSLGGK